MPAKGEYRRPSAPRPEGAATSPSQRRVGIREVVVADACGGTVGCRLDPSGYACRTLAGELADEWVEYVAAAVSSISSIRNYREAVHLFCEFVDEHVAEPGRASLGSTAHDLHSMATEWVRLLPARFSAGSGRPAQLAWALQRLVAQRDQHPDRAVTPELRAWSAGKIGLSKGRTTEVDEFTRSEKRALIRAASKDLMAIEARIAAGWEQARCGADPRVAGFDDPANLLWAIANREMTCQEITAGLPRPRSWSPELRAVLRPRADGVWTRDAVATVTRNLVRRLFLHNLDLQTFRILLMDATGHSSEEVSALTEADVDFGPGGVALTLVKQRANSVRYRPFSRPDAADLLRRLHAIVAPAAEHAGLPSPFPLFLRAAVRHGGLVIRPFLGHQDRSNFRTWVGLHGVAITGAVDIRRLRKSSKVEKAIAYRGRVSDIADDHSEEVFRGHYAHGTTLRVIAGQIVTAAQSRWLEQAVTGPTMLTGAAGALTEEETGQVLGLTGEQVSQLREGQLDMGVTGCRDPFDSPFARAGQLCPVAPLRCLECRHALVLPSNLPQLLLFSDHLDRLRQRLPPVHFTALWGQSAVNLAAALAEHSQAEIAQARKVIEADGVVLQLPLAAHVEFDA